MADLDFRHLLITHLREEGRGLCKWYHSTAILFAKGCHGYGCAGPSTCKTSRSQLVLQIQSSSEREVCYTYAGTSKTGRSQFVLQTVSAGCVIVDTTTSTCSYVNWHHHHVWPVSCLVQQFLGWLAFSHWRQQHEELSRLESTDHDPDNREHITSSSPFAWRVHCEWSHGHQPLHPKTTSYFPSSQPQVCEMSTQNCFRHMASAARN